MLPMPPVYIPEPTVHETVAYYDIGGRNEADLVAQMNSKGPGRGGQRYWGVTHWSVGWDYGTRRDGGRCVLDQTKLWLDIVIILPRWSPPAGTSATVVSKWTRLIAAADRHEHEHARHGLDAIAAVAALMREQGAENDCEALRQRIEHDGQALVEKFSRLDGELDARTRHGATEGVAIQW